MKQILREWFIAAPWGKIALASWGNPKGKLVLLVHGRQDSLATFILLLDLLPDDNYYVGLDLPGHGKSDPFPTGVMLTRLHFVAPLDIVAKALGWKQFIYIGHSMGAELGLFYNALRPGRVRKLVLLDVGLSLLVSAPTSFPDMYRAYKTYYQNYQQHNKNDRLYSKQSAFQAVQHARRLSPELVELVLSRNLIKVHRDQPTRCNEETIPEEATEETYILSWDARLKNLAHYNLSYEQCLHIFTTNLPPTLFFAASESIKKYLNEYPQKIILEMCKRPDFKHVEVKGGHDVHLTNPELLAEEIVSFIRDPDDQIQISRSKL